MVKLSPIWSLTFLVFMQLCGQPQERKKPFKAEITLVRFEDVVFVEHAILESHVISFLRLYLALILVETSGVQRAIFPNLLSSYNHPKAIQKLSLHQGNENSWVSRGVLYLPGFVLRCTWRAGRSRAKM